MIEAGVVARLLGVRILRLDAGVVLTPIQDAPETLERRPEARPSESFAQVHGSSRMDPILPPSGPVPGGALAQAWGLLQDADRSLSEARRDH